MTATLERFYTYIDNHDLGMYLTRKRGGTWHAWIRDNWDVNGIGATVETAVAALAKDVATRGLERVIPAPPPVVSPAARERLPPFLMEAAHG